MIADHPAPSLGQNEQDRDQRGGLRAMTAPACRRHRPRTGRPSASTAAWILVVRPPRERPIPEGVPPGAWNTARARRIGQMLVPMGNPRRRMPVALNSAFAIAGGTGGRPGSPTPVAWVSKPYGTIWVTTLRGKLSARTTS